MATSDTTPIYNLKAVVKETGLKPDTLRAWERRYGLPNPERTDSGHRLYSQRDIDILKWLIERQTEGFSISRAVDLWQQLEQEQEDPLQVGSAEDNSSNSGATTEQQRTMVADGDTKVATIRNEWITACLNFDEQSAEQALSEAFALFSAETVCTLILQKGLAEIGEGWHQGRVTAQQEHFASALAIRRLEAMLASTPAPTRPGRIIVGCPPEEEHTFIPVMLSLLLRRRGYAVVYLGANIPLRSLESTVRTTNPKLVILTAQQLYTAANLLEMADLLYHEAVPLAFGGLIFRNIPDLAKSIPGYYLGDQVDTSLRAIEQIMVSPRLQATQRTTPRRYLEAHDLFRQHQADIEADVWRSMAGGAIPHKRLAAANANLGRNIRAALTLGNMDYLGPDLEWVENLLVEHYQMPVEMLDEYLAAYLNAVRHHLGGQERIISDWFADALGVEDLEWVHMTGQRSQSAD